MRIETKGRNVLRERSASDAVADRSRLFEEAFPLEKRRAILEALAEKALAGDVRVAAFLFDRFYGRPAAVPKPEPSQPADAGRVDLGRLDDEEMDTLAALFRKARDLEQRPAELRGSGGRGPAQALPLGPGGVCEGGP